MEVWPRTANALQNGLHALPAGETPSHATIEGTGQTSCITVHLGYAWRAALPDDPGAVLTAVRDLCAPQFAAGRPSRLACHCSSFCCRPQHCRSTGPDEAGGVIVSAVALAGAEATLTNMSWKSVQALAVPMF